MSQTPKPTDPASALLEGAVCIYFHSEVEPDIPILEEVERTDLYEDLIWIVFV